MPNEQHRSDQADRGLDSYQERVVRNEGELYGLKLLVSETREADGKLVEQRSDSLAQELERRAESLIQLSMDQRTSDNREHRDALAALAKNLKSLRDADRDKNEQALLLLRERYDTAIKKNYEQSEDALDALSTNLQSLRDSLEERARSRVNELAQLVTAHRGSDREARELYAVEVNRRLDALNHADSKRQEFQAQAVTRELFNADKEAQTHRESVLRDQIIALDRTLLGMTPTTVLDKTHSETVSRNELAIKAAAETLDTKINVVANQVSELKSSRDQSAGRGAGYASLYGWLIAAVAAIGTLIVIANLLTGK